MRTMKRVGRAWGLLMLGGALLALPAASARKKGAPPKKPDSCEAQCTEKASGAMQQCVAKCPDAKSNQGAFAYCSQRCSEHFQERFDKCADGCPDKKPQRSKHPTHQGPNNKSRY